MYNNNRKQRNPLEIFERGEDEVMRMDNINSMLRKQAEMEIADLQASRETEMRQIAPDDATMGTYGNTDIRQGAILPKKFSVTQSYMNYAPDIEKYSGGYHTGTDFATPEGTPVALPAGKWRIKNATSGFNSGYGNSVLAENEETGELMRFSHLSRINTAPGSAIMGGSVIGFTGNTGNSTGPHVDIEYMTKGGKTANILNSRYARELYVSY